MMHRISGGEAQKIAIARALYKKAPFIILDEPTAALDPLAEAEVYRRFNEIAENKTAIISAIVFPLAGFVTELLFFITENLSKAARTTRLCRRKRKILRALACAGAVLYGIEQRVA